MNEIWWDKADLFYRGIFDQQDKTLKRIKELIEEQDSLKFADQTDSSQNDIDD